MTLLLTSQLTSRHLSAVLAYLFMAFFAYLGVMYFCGTNNLKSSHGNMTSTVFGEVKGMIFVLIKQTKFLAVLVTPPQADFNNQPRELIVNSQGN